MERTGYTHGYITGVGRVGQAEYHSGFMISSRDMPRSARTEAVLDLIMPHFHHRMERIYKNFGLPTLSERELEVLKWTASGKTAWESSKILSISERTVNFYVSNIMEKLDAVSRMHAVAIAVAKGLVVLE